MKTGNNFCDTHFTKSVLTKDNITHIYVGSPVSGRNLVFFLHASTQPITCTLHLGTTSTLQAYWVTDADEINYLGTEMTETFFQQGILFAITEEHRKHNIHIQSRNSEFLFSYYSKRLIDPNVPDKSNS